MSKAFQIFTLVLMQITGFYVAEKIRFISTERPNLKYWSPKYFTYFNVTARRHGRSDPKYYLEAHFEAKYVPTTLRYTVTADIIFYQFLSNQYKRSFIDMHFLICDAFQTELLFGKDFQQGRLIGCPIPPGHFDLYNMSIPTQNIPNNFPFSKGRISLNLTSTNMAKDLVLYGHVDMEIKEVNTKPRKRQEANLG